MADLSTIFGRQVRALRRARGLTQEQLGRQARVDYKHLGAIERGVKSPSFDAVERLAAALRVEPHRLFVAGPAAAPVDVDAEVRAAAERLTADRRARVRGFLGGVVRLLKKIDGDGA